MRIGTWNLEGRWSDAHEDLLLEANCDVWLLTEVPASLALVGFDQHRTIDLMSSGKGAKHWAAILSTVESQVRNPTLIRPPLLRWSATSESSSSVLPWRTCVGPAWTGETLAETQELAIQPLRLSLASAATIWGGTRTKPSRVVSTSAPFTGAGC